MSVMDQSAPERRTAARQRVYRTGIISFRDLGTTIECAVRNLSDTGACLLMTSPTSIPNEFDLALTRDKAPRHCRVVWRGENKIGVTFQV
jgi:hypothetical protein